MHFVLPARHFAYCADAAPHHASISPSTHIPATTVFNMDPLPLGDEMVDGRPRQSPNFANGVK